MLAKYLSLLAPLAALVAAQPTGTCAPPKPDTFGVVSIHSGNSVQYAGWGAAMNGLLAGLQTQNATCDGVDSGYATFYIKDGALFLYGSSEPAQEFFVDRSGMGQGIIGYTNGDASGPRYGERTGWAINEETQRLTFAGNDFIACPNSVDGAWSIWAASGNNNPGGNSNCVGIAAHIARSTSAPVACEYTTYA